MLAETRHDGQMRFTVVSGWIVRVLFWPCVVLLAINIENWASKEGFADVLAKRAGEFPALIGQVYAAITSQTVFAVALFVGGMATNAWLQKFASAIETGDSWFTRWLDSSTIMSVSDAFMSNGITRRFLNTQKELPRLNKRLDRYGLRHVPTFFSEDESINQAYGKYLKVIVGPVEAGNIEEAKRMGGFVLNHEESERMKRQPHQGTVSKTPL
jgi:hypothetical protein